MLFAYVACKMLYQLNLYTTYVYKHKTLRSRIPRQIILYILSTWLINVVINCASGYATGEKKPSSLFPEDEDLRN